MADAYEASVSAVDELAQEVQESVAAPIAASLREGISTLLRETRRRGLSGASLHRLRDEVLALPAIAEDSDVLSGQVLRPPALAAAWSLDRRLHLAVLGRAASGHHISASAAHSALTWMLANGTEDDKEKVADLSPDTLPDAVEPLRVLAIREVTAETTKEEGEKTRDLLTVSFPEEPERYLVASQKGGPLKPDTREELFSGLDMWAGTGAITAQEVRKAGVGELDVVWLRPSTAERLRELNRELLIEPDVQFYLQSLESSELPAQVEVLVRDQETRKPVERASVTALLRKSLRAHGGYHTRADGLASLPLGNERIASLRVAAPSGYWDRHLEYSAGKRFIVDLRPLPKPTGFSAWWRGVFAHEGSDHHQGQGVLVVLIDSGVDGSHPHLKAEGGWSSRDLENKPWYEDDHGHGTHCAGILVGQSESFRGIASGAKLWVARVMASSQAAASAASLVESIRRATDMGAHVINLSLGGWEQSTILKLAIERAVDRGILVVAAAGNQGRSRVCFPAHLQDVIGVSAFGQFNTYPTDSSHQESESGAIDGPFFFSRYSNSGPGVDFCAPGVAIISAAPGGGYVARDGTSMAAPMVAGAAAAILSSDSEVQRLSGRSRVAALRARLAKKCKTVQTWERGQQGEGAFRP